MLVAKDKGMMQKKQVHPVEYKPITSQIYAIEGIPITPQGHPVAYKSVTSRARTVETRLIAPQSAPVKWGRITPQGGFTLIEILMAMVIFSISFLGLAAGATTVMKSNHSSYNNTVATNLAQDKLEVLRALDPNLIVDGNNTEKIGAVTFTREWSRDDGDVAGLRKIKVIIRWKDQRDHTLTISSAVDL